MVSVRVAPVVSCVSQYATIVERRVAQRTLDAARQGPPDEHLPPPTPTSTTAVRTPFGRFGGALAKTRPDDLAAGVLRAARPAPDLDPAEVDEVVLGNANGAGEDNRNVARMAALLAGLPGLACRARR